MTTETHMDRDRSMRPLDRRIGSSLRRVGASILRSSITHAAMTCGFGVLVSGCSCEEDRPYTPFTVATSPPEEGTAPPAEENTTTAPTSSAFAVAPPNANSWKIFERTLTAPDAGTFEGALSSPSALPEGRRIYAWIKGNAQSGGLWLYEEAGLPTKRIIAAPDFLPGGADCIERARLAWSGQRTLSVDIERNCESRLLPGSPHRAVILLDPQAESAWISGLRVAPSLSNELLAIQVDGADRDQDGTDDIAISFRLGAEDSVEEELEFQWLRRPAGPSREKETPSKSFHARAQKLVLSGQRKAERAEVPARVERLRRLYGAVCAESAAPRVTQWDGSPLSCGSLDASLAELVTASVHAHLGLKEPARAWGEWERSSWYGRGPTTKSLEALQKTLLQKIPNGVAPRITSVSVRLKAPRGGIVASRLRFDPTGQLWALENETTTRLLWPTPPPLGAGGATSDTQPFPAWSLSPGSGKDEALPFAVLPSCERAEVQLALLDPTGTSLPPVSLPVLAPRPGNCRAFGGGPLPSELLAWWGNHVTVSFAGEIFTTPGDAQRSGPSAFRTSLGLGIAQNQELELWKLEGGSEERECVVSSDRKTAACLRDSTVTLWRRPTELSAP